MIDLELPTAAAEKWLKKTGVFVITWDDDDFVPVETRLGMEAQHWSMSIQLEAR